jgi:hypothetical protein
MCRRSEFRPCPVDDVHIGYRKDESAAQSVHLGSSVGGLQVAYPTLDVGAAHSLVEYEQSVCFGHGGCFRSNQASAALVASFLTASVAMSLAGNLVMTEIVKLGK